MTEIESRGLIELRRPDGTTIVDEYERFTREQIQRGRELEHDGCRWVMRDREDRRGVTVYVFTPAGADDEHEPDRPRARSRHGGLR